MSELTQQHLFNVAVIVWLVWLTWRVPTKRADGREPATYDQDQRDMHKLD